MQWPQSPANLKVHSSMQKGGDLMFPHVFDTGLRLAQHQPLKLTTKECRLEGKSLCIAQLLNNVKMVCALLVNLLRSSSWRLTHSLHGKQLIPLQKQLKENFKHVWNSVIPESIKQALDFEESPRVLI